MMAMAMNGSDDGDDEDNGDDGEQLGDGDDEGGDNLACYSLAMPSAR